MSYSIENSMTKTTLPLKGEDVVTVALTMEAEPAAKPRAIVIAWDHFGRNDKIIYLNHIDQVISLVLQDLVGLSGGTGTRLGSGNRVALYGNRSNTGEIRTALTDDVAVIQTALDTAMADPQPGLPISADSIVEMLAGANGRKTVLICTMTYTAVNLGPDTGQQRVCELHVTPHVFHGGTSERRSPCQIPC